MLRKTHEEFKAEINYLKGENALLREQLKGKSIQPLKAPEPINDETKPLEKKEVASSETPPTPTSTTETPKETPETSDLVLENKEEKKVETTETSSEEKEDYKSGKCSDCDIEVVNGICPKCDYNYNE